MNTIGDKIQRSWQLFKRSIAVIRQHPKLLVFPILMGLLTTTIALIFLAPVAMLLWAPHWFEGTRVHSLFSNLSVFHFRRGAHFEFNSSGTALLAIVYLVNLFLATLASVAFNSQILEALAGRPVSIRRGIAVACRRWQSALLWSLLAGVVGLIIRAIEERLAFVGRLIAGLIGLAWSVASIFAIPIIVRDESTVNPFTVLSKSAETIKRTWGEMLTGYLGMQGTNLMVLWGSIVFWVVTGGAAIVFSNAWLLLFAGVPWLLSLFLYGYLASVASRVYLCALYLYAVEGVVPHGYDTSMMNLAWKMKK